MKYHIIQLSQSLIRRPSISPNDEGCQQLIAERLKKLGFHIEWMPFNDTLNLWAKHGSGEPVIAFAGHTDVVPTGDESQWTYPPFSAEIVDGMLYGRGAADMKGSLAAMIVAAEEYVKANPNHDGTIALLITSDEEAVAKDGSVRVVETLMARGEKITYCMVGEPSSSKTLGDVVKNGRRGSITGNLYIQGVQGHVAYPHLAENPIHKASPFLQELTTYQWDNGNEFFPPTSLQIANIHAGTGSNNVIPGEFYVQFNLRYCTEVTAEIIKQKVAEILEIQGISCCRCPKTKYILSPLSACKDSIYLYSLRIICPWGKAAYQFELKLKPENPAVTNVPGHTPPLQHTLPAFAEIPEVLLKGGVV